MHRLRCIITAECQLLFNQIYVQRPRCPLLFFQHIKEEAEQCIKVALSYAALWPMKATLSLQINGIREPALLFQRASSMDVAPDQGAVSIAAPLRFDAPDPAGLMSGHSPQLAPVVSPPLCASSPWLQQTCMNLHTGSERSCEMHPDRFFYSHFKKNSRFKRHEIASTSIYVHFHIDSISLF